MGTSPGSQQRSQSRTSYLDTWSQANGLPGQGSVCPHWAGSWHLGHRSCVCLQGWSTWPGSSRLLHLGLFSSWASPALTGSRSCIFGPWVYQALKCPFPASLLGPSRPREFWQLTVWALEIHFALTPGGFSSVYLCQRQLPSPLYLFPFGMSGTKATEGTQLCLHGCLSIP